MKLRALPLLLLAVAAATPAAAQRRAEPAARLEAGRASTAETVYQLVQALRPMWLSRGGVSGHTNPAPAAPESAPSETPGAAPVMSPSSAADNVGVKVYVERGFVGDIWSLRQFA